MKTQNSLNLIPSLVETIDPRWRQHMNQDGITVRPAILKQVDEVSALVFYSKIGELSFYVSGLCPTPLLTQNKVEQADISLHEVKLSGRPDYKPSEPDTHYLKTILKQVCKIVNEDHVEKRRGFISM